MVEESRRCASSTTRPVSCGIGGSARAGACTATSASSRKAARIIRLIAAIARASVPTRPAGIAVAVAEIDLRHFGLLRLDLELLHRLAGAIEDRMPDDAGEGLEIGVVDPDRVDEIHP